MPLPVSLTYQASFTIVDYLSFLYAGIERFLFKLPGKSHDLVFGSSRGSRVNSLARQSIPGSLFLMISFGIVSGQCDTFTGSATLTTPAECPEDISIVTLTASGGNPPYTFSYGYHPPVITNETSHSFESTAGTGFSWGISTEDCPLISGTLDVPLPTPLNPGAHNTDPITVCQNYNPPELIFLIPASGGKPPYSYQWYQNGNPIDGATYQVHDPLNLLHSGTYTYYCSVTDGCGSSEITDPKIITVVDEAVITITGGGIYCQHDPVTLTSAVNGGTGTMIYQWQQSPDNITWTSIPGANNTTYNPPANNPGHDYYRVNLSVHGAACNDPRSNSQSVIINPIPVTSMILHY